MVIAQQQQLHENTKVNRMQDYYLMIPQSLKFSLLQALNALLIMQMHAECYSFDISNIIFFYDNFCLN